MKYEVYILDVDDADAIVIKYSSDDQNWVTAVIDAGNIGDGDKIKKYVGISKNDCKYHIDYAICTHPDKDHKGGFFDLLKDADVKIANMCVMDPWEYLETDDFVQKYRQNPKKKAREPFNSPISSSENLIEIAEEKKILYKIHEGEYLPDIPLLVLGPQKDYYKQCVLGMVEHFTELKDEPDFEQFDEKTFPDDKESKSVIDKVEDESFTNKSSMVLLFKPSNSKKFLLCGDASSSSLQILVDHKCDDIKHCTIKVPHHGSKHNLTTSIIDWISPISAVISAKGTRKHPNSAVVQWLSKYCNVYSTHKSGSLVYRNVPPDHPATPLKEKIIKK